LKVFVAVEACDLRKGFNGLHGLVTERLGEDPRQARPFQKASTITTICHIFSLITTLDCA
jgi:hypothetical protein